MSQWRCLMPGLRSPWISGIYGLKSSISCLTSCATSTTPAPQQWYNQSCSLRDRSLGLETARDRFFAVLVLVLTLPVLVLASVSKCRSWTSFRDDLCICQTISFGCLFLPVTQVTKFLTSLSLDLLFFVTILTAIISRSIRLGDL